MLRNKLFFKPIPLKNNTKELPQKDVTQKKRPVLALSSDDEFIEGTPNAAKKHTLKKRKESVIIISDDSEDENITKNISKMCETPRRPDKQNLEPANAIDLIDSAPMGASKVEKINNIPTTENIIISEESKVTKNRNFLSALLDSDDFLAKNDDVISEAINEAMINTTKTLNEFSCKEKTFSDEIERKRFEKIQQNAISYQEYLNRDAPAHHGCKTLPKGKPNCLKGLCFIKTGILDSLYNEEFKDLVKKYGGRTVKSVSGKVDYMIVGQDPGPVKLKKAKTLCIPNISEDEFLDIICTKSGMKPMYANNGVGDNSHENDREKKSSSVGLQKNLGVNKTIENRLKTTQNICNVDASIKITNELPQASSSTDKIAPSTTKNYKECKDLKPTETPVETPEINIPWTVKYKPTETKYIIGQQREESCMKKLMNWLEKWDKNHSKSMKGKIQKPSIWLKDHYGANFKCALLSGPPGVGKTTTATLVAKQLGFDIVEFNASDTRNKKSLHEEVTQLLSTTSMSNYVKEGTVTRKRVLLMDEVDGMAGNEDRGGIQELINLIKNTSVPIICTCNDRYHKKIRSLVTYCFDLRFTKPKLEQIKGAMMSVCFKEGIKISPDALSQIITGTGMDIRQTLNHLCFWASVQKTLSPEEAQNNANLAKKDVTVGPWEVCRTVFSEEDNKKMSLSDKFDLFFSDYNICPLIIQENYVEVVPHVPRKKYLVQVASTADSISMGDVISTKIRGSNNWSLLETQGLYSCVLPGYYMSGHLVAQINFPSWLGKNSVKGKRQRLLSEIHSHTSLRTSSSKLAINLDYASHLHRRIVQPLIKLGRDGVDDAINTMKEYNLLREDLDSLGEITKWPKIDDLFAKVDSKVKALFTRTYNQKRPTLPYAIATKKKFAHSVLQEDECIQDNEMEPNIEEDDTNNDGMIIVKRHSQSKDMKRGSSAVNASTSNNKNKKNMSKGRGKKLL